MTKEDIIEREVEEIDDLVAFAWGEHSDVYEQWRSRQMIAMKGALLRAYNAGKAAREEEVLREVRDTIARTKGYGHGDLVPKGRLAQSIRDKFPTHSQEDRKPESGV